MIGAFIELSVWKYWNRFNQIALMYVVLKFNWIYWKSNPRTKSYVYHSSQKCRHWSYTAQVSKPSLGVLLIALSRASYLTSLCLCFLICKKEMKTIIVPTSENAVRNKWIQVYKAITRMLLNEEPWKILFLALSIKKISLSPITIFFYYETL